MLVVDLRHDASLEVDLVELRLAVASVVDNFDGSRVGRQIQCLRLVNRGLVHNAKRALAKLRNILDAVAVQLARLLPLRHPRDNLALSKALTFRVEVVSLGL